MADNTSPYILHSKKSHNEIAREIITFMNDRRWILTHKDTDMLTFIRPVDRLWGGGEEASSFFLDTDEHATRIELRAGVNTQDYGRLLETQLGPPGPRHR